MSNAPFNQYVPDYVSPPGETLLEILETIGMTQAELAQRTGRPKKTINEIIQGKAAMTPETALQFELALGVPARFWNSREQLYRESLARLAKEQRLKDWAGWLKEIPLKTMMERGWIPAVTDKAQQVFEALKFFGVASPEAWHEVWAQETGAFRKASVSEGNIGAVAAWLRQGELEAQSIDCAPYDAEAFRDALGRMRALAVEPPDVFQPKLVRCCASAGVAVTFVPELPQIGIYGATRWLTPNKALIQLSLRYKTDDQLWFTFFHEAAHILLHGKRAIFLEDDIPESSEEEEANVFATDILISPSDR